jgi:hypothetical protein
LDTSKSGGGEYNRSKIVVFSQELILNELQATVNAVTNVSIVVTDCDLRSLAIDLASSPDIDVGFIEKID